MYLKIIMLAVEMTYATTQAGSLASYTFQNAGRGTFYAGISAAGNA
jgi:hypothetical protein